MPNRKLFVTLAVQDPKRSVEFFSKLGFEFLPQFTTDNTCCMQISDAAFVMLATAPFFKSLTPREICETSTHLQALLTVSCESRAEVDKLVQLAIANGGKAAGEPQDHGFMYDWSFYDLDGHGWGVTWMNPSAAPGL